MFPEGHRETIENIHGDGFLIYGLELVRDDKDHTYDWKDSYERIEKKTG